MSQDSATGGDGSSHPTKGPSGLSKEELEEFAVYRVAEKATERLMTWLKWGIAGVVAVAAILGIQINWSLSSIKSSLNTVVEGQVRTAVENEVRSKTRIVDELNREMVTMTANVQVARRDADKEVKEARGQLDELKKSAKDAMQQLDEIRRDIDKIERERKAIKGLASPGTKTTEIPTPMTRFSADISPLIGPIRDQGGRGSVVGYAMAYLVRAAIKTQFDKVFDASAEQIYFNARKLAGQADSDFEGATLEDAFTAIKTIGVIPVGSWPDGQVRAKGVPRPEYRVTQKTHFLKHKDWNEFSKFTKKALSDNQPILCSVEASTAFFNPDKDGRIKLPAGNLAQLQGRPNHCVVVVGFEEATKTVKFANTWGTTWGKEGFGYVAFEDFHRILGEYATISRVEEIKDAKGA